MEPHRIANVNSPLLGPAPPGPQAMHTAPTCGSCEVVGVFLHLQSCAAYHGLQWKWARKDPLHDMVEVRGRQQACRQAGRQAGKWKGVWRPGSVCEPSAPLMVMWVEPASAPWWTASDSQHESPICPTSYLLTRAPLAPSRSLATLSPSPPQELAEKLHDGDCGTDIAVYIELDKFLADMGSFSRAVFVEPLVLWGTAEMDNYIKVGVGACVRDEAGGWVRQAVGEGTQVGCGRGST